MKLTRLTLLALCIVILWLGFAAFLWYGQGDTLFDRPFRLERHDHAQELRHIIIQQIEREGARPYEIHPLRKGIERFFVGNI